MKDNIKNIFDNAIESDDTNISAEKIQNTVIERLGKQASENLKLSDAEETVEPVFVTTPQKKGKFTALKIAAGAAAACLGVVVIGNAVNRSNNGLYTFSENVTETKEYTAEVIKEVTDEAVNAVTEESVTQEAPEETAEETKSEYQQNIESTVSEKAPEDIPIVDCVPNMSDYSYSMHLVENPIVEFRLLDGSLIQYSNEKGVSHHGNENPNYLLSYKDCRLYYTGNGQNKDITDLISNGNYFQDYYINSVTGFKHYIIVSGDLDKKDFGYIDLFKINEEDDEGDKCILWSFDGTYNFDSDKYIGKKVDDDEDIYHSDWWDNIQKVIYEKLSENHADDEYVILNGAGGCTDLSKVN